MATNPGSSLTMFAVMLSIKAGKFPLFISFMVSEYHIYWVVEGDFK
jgi:hypothetical protein